MLKIEEYDNYYIDENGNVYRKLKPKTDEHGYFRVGLSKGGKQKWVFNHRLVAKTFIDNPNNYPIVNHKNGIKTDNRVENLEWCTSQQNILHAYNNGLKAGISASHVGEKNPKSKLKENDVIKILKRKTNKENIRDVYKDYESKITFKGFEQIWYGFRWKYLVEKV